MEKILEIGATIAGLLQGYLAMLNKRSNWIAYGIQMILMIVFSFMMKLYGDVTNCVFYLGVAIVGFVVWNRKDNSDIKRCNWMERIIYILIIALGTFVFANVLSKTDDPLPVLDAFTTVSSFVATYYMIVKKIDTWIIWFINDVFYAIEYFILPNQAFYLFLLNVVWVFMAVGSYINWRKIMKGEN